MPTRTCPGSRWATPVLAIILCFALLAPSLAFAQAGVAPGDGATIANTRGESILLRSDPSHDAEVLGQFPEGTSVAVIDGPYTDSDGSEWYGILIGETSGYLMAAYLTPSAGEAEEVAEALETEPATVETTVSTSSVPEEPSVSTVGTGGPGTAITTTSLNLRAGPSLTERVLTVMPAGTTVSLTGNAQSGFYPVSYNGVSGWASADYLRQATDVDSDPNAGTGTAQTTAWVNFRSGPGTSYGIISVIPSGASIALTGESSNGFLGIIYSGLSGWVHSDYVTVGGASPAPAPAPEPAPGASIGTARVTTNLHLRQGPSTADASLTVMPAGATVSITGSAQNNFLPITYNGTSGWAYADYLDVGGGSDAPDEPVPPPASATAVTTASLNLRSNPSLSASVILVMPAGATVTITGGPQSGFYPVTYSGQSGWASTDYLRQGNEATPTPAPGSGGSGIIWPVSGSTWSIIQGYNGGTHQNRSSSAQYYYALDFSRTDGNTAGQAVYAPASGRILWNHSDSGGIAIDMGNGYVIAMFHCTFDAGLQSGQSVEQGQYLGTISGPGGAGYASTPHVDMTLWQSSDGGRTRIAAPFTDGNAISGTSFPDIGGWNQHYGTRFNP